MRVERVCFGKAMSRKLSLLVSDEELETVVVFFFIGRQSQILKKG